MCKFISRVRLNKEVKDVQAWGGDASREFSVRSAYVCLANHACNPYNSIFKILWQAKAFWNVLTTAWRVLMDRIPTRSSLSRRGVGIPLNCVMCQASNESSQHLFVGCIISQWGWDQYFRWIGIMFVQHKDLRRHFENFVLPNGSLKQNLVWKGMWVIVVWCIWERGIILYSGKGWRTWRRSSKWHN